MLRKTMAVGEEVCVTGCTGVASHRACCAEGFASPRGRRGRIAAAGSRRAMSEVNGGKEGRRLLIVWLRKKSKLSNQNQNQYQSGRKAPN